MDCSLIRQKCQIRNVELSSSLFTNEGLSATEITKELADVYGHSAPSYFTVAKWVTEFNNPIRAFEYTPRSSRLSTTMTVENIRSVEEVVIEKFLFDA